MSDWGEGHAALIDERVDERAGGKRLDLGESESDLGDLDDLDERASAGRCRHDPERFVDRPDV